MTRGEGRKSEHFAGVIYGIFRYANAGSYGSRTNLLKCVPFSVRNRYIGMQSTLEGLAKLESLDIANLFFRNIFSSRLKDLELGIKPYILNSI